MMADLDLPTEEPRCGLCVFFDRGAYKGWCKYAPPQLHQYTREDGIAEFMTIRPETHETDLCGEFRSKDRMLSLQAYLTQLAFHRGCESYKESGLFGKGTQPSQT